MRAVLLALAACAALVAAALAQPAPGARSAKPSRIVSLNLCVDQLALAVADPANVASVTWLATDPASSVMAEVAKRVRRINYGFAEEILPLAPDLVLAGQFTTPFTVQTLRRVGFNVEVLKLPATLDDLRAQIRLVGDLVQERARAEDVIAALDARLAAAAAPAGTRAPRAAIFQPGGFTAGRGSFEHELLRAAGLANVANERRIEFYGYLSLEEVLMLRPDLVVSPGYVPGRPSIAEQVLAHPALRKAGVAQRVVAVPSNLWNCPGPMNAEAVAIMARARDAVPPHPIPPPQGGREL
jgi:iron complex transport system substrate-binding protein